MEWFCSWLERSDSRLPSVHDLPDEIWLIILEFVVGNADQDSAMWLAYVRVCRRWRGLIGGYVRTLHFDGPALARRRPYYREKRKFNSHWIPPTLAELENETVSRTGDYTLSAFCGLRRLVLWNADCLDIKVAVFNMPNLMALHISDFDIVPATTISLLTQLRELRIGRAIGEPDFLVPLIGLTSLQYRIPHLKRTLANDTNVTQTCWLTLILDKLSCLRKLSAEEEFFDHPIKSLGSYFYIALVGCLPYLSSLSIGVPRLSGQTEPTLFLIDLPSLTDLSVGFGTEVLPHSFPLIPPSDTKPLRSLRYNSSSDSHFKLFHLAALTQLSVAVRLPLSVEVYLSSLTTLEHLELFTQMRGLSVPAGTRHTLYEALPHFHGLRILSLNPKLAWNNGTHILAILSHSTLVLEELRFPYISWPADQPPVDARTWHYLRAFPKLRLVEASEHIFWCPCITGNLLRLNILFHATQFHHDTDCIFEQLKGTVISRLEIWVLPEVEASRRHMYMSFHVWPEYDERDIEQAVLYCNRGNIPRWLPNYISTEPLQHHPCPHITASGQRRLEDECGFQIVCK